MRRDAHGEPLDEVRAIADGHGRLCESRAGASNYGRYVVVEHRWGGCPYYSLYAHLNTIAVEAGQTVRQGEKLGVMGHTGTGINRERSHVHVELNLLLNDHFESGTTPLSRKIRTSMASTTGSTLPGSTWRGSSCAAQGFSPHHSRVSRPGRSLLQSDRAELA